MRNKKRQYVYKISDVSQDNDELGFYSSMENALQFIINNYRVKGIRVSNLRSVVKKVGISWIKVNDDNVELEVDRILLNTN